MCLSAFKDVGDPALALGLNPCYVGCASRLEEIANGLLTGDWVLILVMLDVPLGLCLVLFMLCSPLIKVLILVMLDVPLGYYSGNSVSIKLRIVLILVMLDVPLGFI